VPANGPQPKRGRVRNVKVGLAKAATGIVGFDEITFGGLPRGRTTLVCGASGSGKTLLALEFLVRGAQQFGEPGVIVAFEESPEELACDVASLGFDLTALTSAGTLSIDHVETETVASTETGCYSLDGLFLRLEWAIGQTNAKRVVLDTPEALFSVLGDERTLRSEIRRLFRWLNDRGMTSLVTAERGDGALTRYGLEEYVSDCVIALDQRVERQTTTRRLRVVKYRGSPHGGNEFPFIITSHGISVVPLTSLVLKHRGVQQRVSTGIPSLDEMLGGKGFFVGSSVLVSGSAGAGKSSIAAKFLDAACARGERALYLACEESPDEISRNMRSIGLDLGRWVKRGLLALEAQRPSSFGFEAHLARIYELVESFAPNVVVLDPVSAFNGPPDEVASLVARIADMLKSRGITALLTSILPSDDEIAAERFGISSTMDVWIAVRTVASNGERNCLLEVIKARGIAHSNQLREFVISDGGLGLLEVCRGDDGVAIGSERVARQWEQRMREEERARSLAREHQLLEQKRVVVDAQIAALQAERGLANGQVADTESAIASNTDSEHAIRGAIGRGTLCDPSREAAATPDDRNGTPAPR
jgi:circadian clock protein KaiC